MGISVAKVIEESKLQIELELHKAGVFKNERDSKFGGIDEVSEEGSVSDEDSDASS